MIPDSTGRAALPVAALPVLLGLLLALLLPAGAGARAGERLEVDALEYPWSAVGRLNAGGQAHCSGVLVGERTVLTAAHCLYNPRGHRRWLVSELHFVAGYQRGVFPLHSPVRAAVAADGYIAADHPEPVAESADWAVLELELPLGRQAGWLGIEPLTAGTEARMHHQHVPVVLAGYRADRSQIITIDHRCELLGFFPDSRVVAHSCNALHGDSGGPLLSFESGEARVIGVHAITVTTAETKAGETKAGPGRKIGGAVASTVLSDAGSWPRAAAAVAAAGLVLPSAGRPPEPGGPATAVPATTVAALLRLSDAGPIEAFQRSHGLAATGSASVALLAVLLANSRP